MDRFFLYWQPYLTVLNYYTVFRCSEKLNRTLPNKNPLLNNSPAPLLLLLRYLFHVYLPTYMLKTHPRIVDAIYAGGACTWLFMMDNVD